MTSCLEKERELPRPLGRGNSLRSRYLQDVRFFEPLNTVKNERDNGVLVLCVHLS